MWPYWLMFAVPALVALMSEVRRSAGRPAGAPVRLNGAWLAVAMALTLLIGYRYEVGGDWFNYLHHLDQVRGATLDEVLQMSDPGYHFINWLSAELDLDIFGVNLMSGALFAVGLVVFCRHLPRPWLALAVAVPYTVIVVAMGYSRQGIALGVAMLGLVALGKGAPGRFVFWVMLAATFHKTAVLLLPIAALAAARNRMLAFAWGAGSLALGYWLFLADAAEQLYTNYVEAQYQSSGAMIRLAMNLLPAIILFLLRDRFRFAEAQRKLWLWFSVISLGLFGIFLVSPASTAVDRIALYMLPLQLVVFSHLPDVVSKRTVRDVAGPVAAVLLYYGLVEFVWLNFADHAFAWLPYRFYPLEAWF